MAISPDIESGPFIGNGAQTAFPFSFTAITPAEVAVELDGVAQSAGFTVTLADVGGTVTFGTAPASGTHIVLRSSPDYLQDSLFENEGAYNLATVNTINRRASVRANWLYRKFVAVLALNKGDKGDKGDGGPPGPEGPIGGSVFPNGTRQRFLDLVATAGSSVGATEQAALLDVEHRLRATGILPKIVRLDLFVGAGAAAARIPFVQRSGCGTSSAAGTISSWTQTGGLTGPTFDTGVTLQQGGLGGYNLGLGCYSLADASAEAGYVVGGSAWGLKPFTGDTSFATASFITFDFAGRVLGDIATISGNASANYRSGGSMHGLRLASGAGVVVRNGVQLQGGSFTTFPDATATFPTDTISYRTGVAALGAAWITDGMTTHEAAMLHWIVHQFNIAIGRAASGEGL